MTDADLIYNALLRAGKRIEERMADLDVDGAAYGECCTVLYAIETIREEIGNGLAERSHPHDPS